MSALPWAMSVLRPHRLTLDLATDVTTCDVPDWTASISSGLNIQVLHVQRVVFDEFAAGFNVFAHESGEDGFALGDVFKLH